MSFLRLRGALSDDQLSVLDREVAAQGAGRRFSLSVTLDRVLRAGAIAGPVAAILPEAKPVRVLGFGKCGARGRRRPWHQDRVISLANRANLAGFTNWSHRRGVWQCEPPVAFLRQMLFARVFLEDVDEGGLEIAIGSDALGRVPVTKAARSAERYPSIREAGRRGDVLLVPALTLHRAGDCPGAPRRILRVDYAAGALPSPLRWAA